MRTNKKIYSFFHVVSALFMVVALLWLTVSTPFVFASQQYAAKQGKIAEAPFPLSGNEEETANPFGNTTEEKTPGASSFSEEYLHDNHPTDHFFSMILRYHKGENSRTYIAFHGELLVPPPNIA